VPKLAAGPDGQTDFNLVLSESQMSILIYYMSKVENINYSKMSCYQFFLSNQE